MKTAQTTEEGRRGTRTPTVEARRGVTRLNLALPVDARARIEALQQETGATSITETIGDALRLYEWFVQQRKSGRQVQLRSPDGETVLVEFVF
jgi:hypothetical protein